MHSRRDNRGTPSGRSYVWYDRAYWNALRFAIVAAAFILLGMVDINNGTRGQLRQSDSELTVHCAQPSVYSELSPVLDFQKRRLYPYSVIPGGLESVRELRTAVAHDPLVAAHYANFDLARARIVRLDRDEAVYVSFRLNDRIYWTKRTLMLHRGETVITDGEHDARTRCGNRISIAPPGPVSPEEPSAQAMEAALNFPLVAAVPELWPSPDPLMPAVFESPASLAPNPSGGIIPPPYYPIVGGGPEPNSPIVSPPPIVTPEPSAFILLALGLLTLGSASWRVYLANKLSRT